MQISKILVVDDCEPFRRLICSILERRIETQTVEQASDGLEAVQIAERLQPDLVLLDIGLPNLSGMNAAARIRQLAPRAKILFVSLESSKDVVGTALDLGALGYVHKSRIDSDLMPAIETVLRGNHFVSSSLEFALAERGNAGRGHQIVFCGDEGALLGGLADFIGEALNAGNAAIVWATESHRKILVDRLRAHGVKIDLAVQRGTYISSDVSETADRLQLLAVLARLREAAHCAGAEHPRIAVCGERAGCLWAEGKVDEALRLEQLWEELGAMQGDLDILCVYPTAPGDEDDQALKSICAEHTAVYSR